jgi:hypothetical protein
MLGIHLVHKTPEPLLILHHLWIGGRLKKKAEGLTASGKYRAPLATTVSEDEPASATFCFGADIPCSNRQELSIFVRALGLFGISGNPLVEVSQLIINTRAPVVQ